MFKNASSMYYRCIIRSDFIYIILQYSFVKELDITLTSYGLYMKIIDCKRLKLKFCSDVLVMFLKM